MTSLKRKVSMRRDAAAARETARKAAVVGRTGQVARAVVAGVPVEGAIVQSEGTATVVDGLGSDVARLDDGTVWDAAEAVIRVPVADDYIEDLSQRQDEANDALGSLDEWRDDRYDVDEAAGVEGDGLRADVEQAGRDVEAAQAEAAQAAADALDAAAVSAAASQAAAAAQATAAAAQGDATQAIADAESKSAAAEAAAKAYAEAQAAAAEAAAVAEASGDATAKADAAQLAAEAAAAADASAKAAAAEAAAKADAAAAQATADAAAGAASDAQDAADSVRFLAEGLYQAIPSVTAPTVSPTGALKQGDLWFKIGAAGTNVEGKFVGVQVWDGTQWQPREMLADSLMVVGPDGVVRVANGKVTAESMAASFYYGREFYGGLFSGGLFQVSQGETEVWSVPPVTTSEEFDTWWSDAPRLGTTWSTPDAAIQMTSNGSTRAMFTTTDELPAYPFGAVVEVTFRVKATQLASGGGTPRVSANVYWDGVTPGVPTVPVLDEWVDVSTQLPVPPGVAVGRITIDAIQPGGTSTYLIDGLSAKVTRFDGESLVVGRDAKGAPIIRFGRSGATTTISPSNALIGGRFTNPGNTFALKSQLDAWSPIDGTHAWVSSEGREYVRAAGRWFPVLGGGVLATSPGIFLNDTQTVTLSERVSDQPTGIMLVWSRYQDSSSSVMDNNWNYTPIPKWAVGKGATAIPLSMYTGTGDPVSGAKAVAVWDTSITGYAFNNVGPNRNFVLRAVLGY